ncbi:MAG: phage holin family protein, partial [Candidatus Deferrimicrobiaceae bacterium]
MPFLVRMGANAIAILLIAYLLPQVMLADGVLAALAAAFVLGLVNAVI